MPRKPRTDPYLKGLTDTRARLKGQAQRWARRAEQLITVEIPALKKTLARAQARSRHCARQQAVATRKIEECDYLIRDFDCGIDPACTAVVNAWAGRYGKRGNLGSRLKSLLQRHPDGLSTWAIAGILEAEFGITFLSKQERKTWVDNTVRHWLKGRRRAGLVEVSYLREGVMNTGALWRWKREDVSLDGVRSRTRATGLAVREVDEDDGGFE